MIDSFPKWWMPCGVCVLVSAIGDACAQVPPNAGSLLQQIDRDRPSTVRPAMPAATPMPPPLPAPKDPQLTVTVAAFKFAGNTLLTDDKLQSAVASFLNRPLSFSDLQAAAAAVGVIYRQAGWVVRVYLPEQSIEQGVITIQVVEAVFGKINLQGKDLENLRISPQRLVSMVARAQPAGEFIHGDAIDRVLLLLDDLPGVVANGSLGEGQSDRETDLLLSLAHEPWVNGDVGVDNTGSRSTGPTRRTANLTANSPFRFGDVLSTSLLDTAGSQYARLAATLPLGYDGWRAGVSVSSMRYRTITPEFAALDIHGSSATSGLDLTYPLLRSRLKNLNFLVNVDRKRFHNESAGAVTTDYNVSTLSLGLNASLIDNFAGGGANSGSLTWVRGKLDLSGSPNAAADALTTQTAGNFSKLRYSLTRQQVLTEQWGLFVSWSGQVANKNLDSAEKFYLGGSSGVRAYPSSEGGGAEGQMLNVEARWRLTEKLTLTGLYDWGRVKVNKKNDIAGAEALNQFSLKGAGLSLAWQTPLGLSLKATWARRIGDNPNPTATGNDQDGTLKKNRYWVTLSLPF